MCGVVIIASLLVFQNFYSCTARQFSLIDEIVQYEQTMNPNACIAIAEKIYRLNIDCGTGIETLDCR